MSSSIGVICGWSCLLGLSLITPTSLPAGGGLRTSPAIRRREVNEPLIAKDGCTLFTSPVSLVSTAQKIKVGTPLKVLRSWQSSDGSCWLYVQAFSSNKGLLFDHSFRGWLNA